MTASIANNLNDVHLISWIPKSVYKCYQTAIKWKTELRGNSPFFTAASHEKPGSVEALAEVAMFPATRKWVSVAQAQQLWQPMRGTTTWRRSRRLSKPNTHRSIRNMNVSIFNAILMQRTCDGAVMRGREGKEDSRICFVSTCGVS